MNSFGLLNVLAKDHNYIYLFFNTIFMTFFEHGLAGEYSLTPEQKEIAFRYWKRYFSQVETWEEFELSTKKWIFRETWRYNERFGPEEMVLTIEIQEGGRAILDINPTKKYHIHLYQTAKLFTVDIKADNEQEAMKKAHTLVRQGKIEGTAPDQEYIAIPFEDK